MKKHLRPLTKIFVCLLCISILFSFAGCSKKSATALDPKNPVTITVWNYYNGDQLEAFNKLVKEFNSSVGLEKGIIVENVSHGNIDALATALIASVNGDAGAEAVPSLAAVYSETAFILDQKGALTALDSYFTKEELDKYISGFIEEGRFNAANELQLFPIIKSTELFSANATDWEEFAKATGITLESITTKEQLTAAAQKYYEWTDSLTPNVPEDGKALYGRDSVSNYIYIGTHQLGHDLFTVKDGKLTVDLDRNTFKTLWDNYYIPYINGYFGAYASFRSEDCKTGKILSLTSSSSSASYLPTAVTTQDDKSHDIETFICKDLPFANSNGDIVQQGASYCVLKKTAAEQEGAVEFLKWFTEPTRNIDFALMTGYSPVTIEANTKDAISGAYKGDSSTLKGKNVLDALLISSEAFSSCGNYAVKPFEGSKDARTLLGTMFEETAKKDREAVEKAIAGGATRKEATASYTTDAYFDAFLNDLSKQVNELVK